MHHPILPAALLATLVVLAGCGQSPVSTSSGKSPTSSTAAAGRVPSPRPSGTVTGMVTLTLPVRKLPTVFGVDNHPVVPRMLTVRIPAQWAKDLGAYWSGQVFLGPAGWTGNGLIGADGSEAIALHPQGGSASTGPRIVITGSGGCFGCGAQAAASFFQAVRDHWSRYQTIPGPPPPKAQVKSEVYLTPNVLAYQLPNTADGLEVNGVAYSGLIGQFTGLTFESMQTVLPSAQHGLASIILNYFLKHNLP